MRFPIGTKYKTRGKHPRICTITDYLVTTNLAGDIVKCRYISTHEFLGQTVTNHDVVEATVSLGLIKDNDTK